MIFKVNEQSELDALRSERLFETLHLYGWTLSYYPHTHSTNTDKFFFQTQYTLSSYRDEDGLSVRERIGKKRTEHVVSRNMLRSFSVLHP
ncbi:hypothetical protein [Fictibacillus nanhaiensis]|uniref:hypothetical protein n=1 Tax=Fictibacillus nanhaiensis TaxID=742169 RepID=UPI003C265FFE